MEDQFGGKCTKNVRARAVLFLECFDRFLWVLLILAHFGPAEKCVVSYILAALAAWGGCLLFHFCLIFAEKTNGVATEEQSDGVVFFCLSFARGRNHCLAALRGRRAGQCLAEKCVVSYILAALAAWLFAFPFLLNFRGQNK